MLKKLMVIVSIVGSMLINYEVVEYNVGSDEYGIYGVDKDGYRLHFTQDDVYFDQKVKNGDKVIAIFEPSEYEEGDLVAVIRIP